MIKLLLYCSYSGSAVGYQRAIVDEAAKTVRRPREGEVPKLVGQIWTHGGASAAAGVEGAGAYFLVKRMEYQNRDKQQDEQGRKVYMNCAFTGNSRAELQYLADGFLSHYKAAVLELGDLLTVDDSEIGYTIQDFDRFQRLVRACISAGRRIRTSRVGVLEGAISFVALEGDWSYFTSQNAVPAFPRPKTMLTAADYQRMLAESRESFPPPEQEASPPKPPAAPAVPRKAEAVPPVPPAPPAPPVPPPPEANRAEKPPVPPPDPAGLSADAERRMAKLLQEELAQERTRLETIRRDLLNRLEQLEQKIKRQDLWIKVNLALSLAAILLTLLLHYWGGGR